MRRTLLLAVPCCLAAAMAFAGPQPEIDGAWLREPAPGQPALAVYLQLRNAGTAATVLTGARVAGAGSAAVHQHTMVDGMMRMGEAPPLPLAAGAELRFAPGGYHLMVFGVAPPPRAGALQPFCLLFEGGLERCAEARVLAVGEAP